MPRPPGPVSQQPLHSLWPIVPDELAGAPFAAIFAFFFAVAFIRTLVTYWVARFVAGQTIDRTQPQRTVLVRAQTWSRSRAAQRGTAFINRWGVLAVPLSFCAVGTKTIVNAAAGLTRMPFLRRYLPALVVGCLVHATIYATVGWAAWTAALAAATGSAWGAVALIVLLALMAVGLALVLRRRRPGVQPRDADGSPGTLKI